MIQALWPLVVVAVWQQLRRYPTLHQLLQVLQTERWALFWIWIKASVLLYYLCYITSCVKNIMYLSIKDKVHTLLKQKYEFHTKKVWFPDSHRAYQFWVCNAYYQMEGMNSILNLGMICILNFLFKYHLNNYYLLNICK